MIDFLVNCISAPYIISQSHKVAYFYDVGSTYAIDQKINHLHNDRVANMWRNNVPSMAYAVEDNVERKKN
jgi:hypothetical protein